MEIKPSSGIGNIKFGMSQLEVIAVMGKPDKITFNEDDEHQNEVYQYNNFKLMLSFYKTEKNKLSYIRTSNSNVHLNGVKIIGRKITDVITDLNTSSEDWIEELYFTFNAYFNLERWLTLHEEYECVTNIEMGTTFIEGTDETYWPD